MQFITYLRAKLPFFVALSLLFVLASCGSYQYVGTDNDGIYNSSMEVPVEETSVAQTTTNPNNSYYKELFGEKSKQFENISQSNNAIFTDIDSYSGDYDDSADVEPNQYEGYAGWGQDNQDVNIHIYNNDVWGWNTFGWGYAGWGYRPWGWNRWGWNTGWGWNNWGYGGFYDPWYPHYGYGFYGGYYGGFHGGFYGSYYGNNYNRNQVSFNSGRRGSVNAYNANRNSTVTRRGSNGDFTSSRNSSISRRNSQGTNNTSVNTNTTTRRNTDARTNTNTSTTRRTNNVNTNTRNSDNRGSSPSISRGSSGSSSSGSSGGGRSSGSSGGGRRGG